MFSVKCWIYYGQLIFIFILTSSCLMSCGGFKDYPAASIEEVSYLKNAETKTENGITVTVSVLTIEDSKKLFGVDLSKKGVQPVWVEITNDTDEDFVFLPVSLDPDYFAPNEVAFLYQGLFSGGEVHPQLSERFNRYGYNLEAISPGETRNGFIYTNFDPGIKYVNLDLLSDEKIETFVFYIVVEEEGVLYEDIDFDTLYSEHEYKKYDSESELIKGIKALHCCIKSGEDNNDVYPINFVFIGDDELVFSALVRRGWDVTEPYSEVWKKIDVKKYYTTPLFRTSPMQELLYFGRTQDVSLQKVRRRDKGTVRQRNEIRIWLSPIKYKGKNVWVGTTTRDIGTDDNKFDDFYTRKIDPDLNETRYYLEEDMVLSQNVSRIGWIRTHEPNTESDPKVNSNGQVWWSDGLALVLIFSEDTATLSEITFLDWEFPMGASVVNEDIPAAN